jgi:hypothetical protein
MKKKAENKHKNNSEAKDYTNNYTTNEAPIRELVTLWWQFNKVSEGKLVKNQ